jgi:hypothetical protein
MGATAEYADGKVYIYYDYPNDQDPHLYIDDDLADGNPGVNKGIAFRDPSHGSDCAFIRDKQGRFHVIYEDWSPINASKRSWDSPLVGHAVSKDGIGGFEILKPPIDKRTKPTGTVAEYKHPHWKQHPDWDTNIGKYNVHKPEQGEDVLLAVEVARDVERRADDGRSAMTFAQSGRFPEQPGALRRPRLQ